MSTLVADTTMPDWAKDLRRRYLRGESSQFIAHGNVHDLVVHNGKIFAVSEFLTQVLFEKKDNVILYNVSTGVRFGKRKMSIDGYEDLVTQKDPAKVLPLLERALTTQDNLAVIIEYADTIAPASDTAFSTVDDRAAAVTLHRWSLLRSLEKSDSIVVLVLENLSELHGKLVSNPRIGTVQIPMPDLEERIALLAVVAPAMPAAERQRYAETTAGLKQIQIRAILAPTDSTPGDDLEARRKFIIALLSPSGAPNADTLERAEKLTQLTNGMSRDAIRKLIAPDGKLPDDTRERDSSARAEVDRLIATRKREIIERECYGLIEFVEPQHGFEVVGGMEEVKKDLLTVADNMREGRRNRCPMGILFTGPMGTGKTFVAEAFAKECGLTAVKLKNFRSKWVGSTEGNLERILTVIQAIGQVIVIIDEGDRAFGNSGDGDGDGGTSSRVIARIKEFMSDTENRGRVLFVLMTNRPDKLDIDIKRAGRLDRKIPFLYPQTAAEVANVLRAQLKKHKVKNALEWPRDEALLEKIIGYSNADIEAVVMLASDITLQRDPDVAAATTVEDLQQAMRDYLPARDEKMLSLMELLAVFEASNRKMLPKKYADMPIEELQARLDLLKLEVGNRR